MGGIGCQKLIGDIIYIQICMPGSKTDWRYRVSETYWGYHLYAGIACLEVQQMGGVGCQKLYWE